MNKYDLELKYIDKKVLEYLKKILKNMNINILGNTKGNIFDLMNIRKLEGWCWQTTESAIVFFKDNDYIERGNLYIDNNEEGYYHSWIVFKYKNKEYVFDPCLKIICDKNKYKKAFDITFIRGKVSAKVVREQLIKEYNIKIKEDNNLNKIFKNFLGDNYDRINNELKDEISIKSTENPNLPFFRNSCGYKLVHDNKKIKKMNVHYYYGEG